MIGMGFVKMWGGLFSVVQRSDTDIDKKTKKRGIGVVYYLPVYQCPALKYSKFNFSNFQ